MPASLIRKTKSPFAADHSQCQEHHQPFRFIWLVHNDDSEKWWEDWKIPSSWNVLGKTHVFKVVLDMKKHAEMLKDAWRVESFFFNENS